MPMEEGQISVGLLLGLAQGFLQWKALDDAQTSLETYNQAIKNVDTTSVVSLATSIKNATSTLYDDMNETYDQQKIAALIGAGAQVLDL